MGQRHDLRCDKCGYEIDALLGIGMLYAPQNIFKGDQPLLSKLVNDDKITLPVLKSVANGAEISNDYGHELYTCPKDFYLFDKFYFKVGNCQPDYHCPYCETSLQRVTFAKGSALKTRLKFIDQEKFWQCPRCGNAEMTEVNFGNWD